MVVKCDNCKYSFEKPTGSVNRSKKLGRNIFCSKECLGNFKAITQKCCTCGIDFKKSKHLVEKQKSYEDPLPYCSLKCRNKKRKSNPKKCNRCGMVKQRSEFRNRTKIRNGKTYTYINNQCLECDAKAAKSYYDSQKYNEDFRTKNKVRVKIYSEKNSEKVKKYNKLRRQIPENKKRHNSYCRKYNYEMPDYYVVKNLKDSKSPITPENISLKRIQILINRINKKIKRNEK